MVSQLQHRTLQAQVGVYRALWVQGKSREYFPEEVTPLLSSEGEVEIS